MIFFWIKIFRILKNINAFLCIKLQLMFSQQPFEFFGTITCTKNTKHIFINASSNVK